MLRGRIRRIKSLDCYQDGKSLKELAKALRDGGGDTVEIEEIEYEIGYFFIFNL